MWKVKYWQAVIDKSPPNVPRWKLTNVSDEIWREAGAWRPDNRRRNRVGKLNLNSPATQSLFVCGVSTMSIHLVFWFKLKSIKRGRENWGKSVRVWPPTAARARQSKSKKNIFLLDDPCHGPWPWSLKLTNVIYPPLHYDLCSLILEYVAPWPLDVLAISNLSEIPDSHHSLVVLSVAGNEKVL